jgi:hypothetical protein
MKVVPTGILVALSRPRISGLLCFPITYACFASAIDMPRNCHTLYQGRISSGPVGDTRSNGIMPVLPKQSRTGRKSFTNLVDISAKKLSLDKSKTIDFFF